MNSIYVPFDFSPYSTTIKTTSYTVPAGYRARVKPLYSDFTIDSASPMKIGTKPFHSIGGSGDYYLIGTPGNIFLQMVQSGGSGLSYAFYWVSGTTDTQLNSSSSIDCVALAGAAVAATPDLTVGSLYVKVSYSIAPSSLSVDTYAKELDWIWVPTGTALAGSRYIVELYPNLG